MSPLIKRSVARGFTLIELLIVVIILAILAAIAIPQFTASTADAQFSALDANLATVRSALEQYRVQHTNNAYPGAVASTGGIACPGGGNSTAAAVGEVAMRMQLTSFTNAAGETCAIGDRVNFRFGPYLRAIPVEPFTNVNTVAISAAAPVPGEANGLGWAYNVTSGQFVKNNSAADGLAAAGAAAANIRTFAQH
jgi:prepilin-type N-terminal cleavage/methylation domain-containing protein